MNFSGITKKSRPKTKKSTTATGGTSRSTAPSEFPSRDRGERSGSGSGLLIAEEKGADDVEWNRSLAWLVEAFPMISVKEVGNAFREAEGDAGRAAEILSGRDGAKEAAHCRGRQKKKKKKVAAATGLVSNVIGKEYRGMSGGEKREFERGQGGWKENCGPEEVEEFLFEMIGDSCELGYGVIRDVFGNCGYNVEVTLDTLLDMSASSYKKHNHSDFDGSIPNKQKYLSISKESSFDGHGNNDNNIQEWKTQLEDGSSDSKCQPHEKIVDFPVSASCDSRLHTSSFECPSSLIETKEKDLPQTVLESFFNIIDISKYEPNCMNWKMVVKKLEAYGEAFELNSAGSTETLQQASNVSRICDFDDTYHRLRSVARQHWDTMKSYYQKAALAHAKGEWATAAHLSEQGKHYRKLAQEADEKASRDIFEAKNRNIKNVITIDLHGQHVQQAIILLKLHVLMLAYSPAIQLLKVITGSGTHGVGKGKLKQSAIDFFKKEGIHWHEENSGTLIVEVDRFKKYSFLNSDSDSE